MVSERVGNRKIAQAALNCVGPIALRENVTIIKRGLEKRYVVGSVCVYIMRRHKDRDESRRFHHAAMSDDHIPPTSSKPLDEARRRYLDAVPPLHPEWPPDMQVVFRETMRRLLDEGVTAKEIVGDCGFRSHDIYSRFRYEVGLGIKGLIVEFRMRLAKQLLREYEDASITYVAYTVGYGSLSGFSTTFKRHVDCTPTEYRKREEGRKEDCRMHVWHV